MSKSKVKKNVSNKDIAKFKAALDKINSVPRIVLPYNLCVQCQCGWYGGAGELIKLGKCPKCHNVVLLRKDPKCGKDSSLVPNFIFSKGFVSGLVIIVLLASLCVWTTFLLCFMQPSILRDFLAYLSGAIYAGLGMVAWHKINGDKE